MGSPTRLKGLSAEAGLQCSSSSSSFPSRIRLAGGIWPTITMQDFYEHGQRGSGFGGERICVKNFLAARLTRL